jgi:GalNAc-alpha-(1->4)-GalNAc-alpha-(1->3)-diNAcBac-PP-undecaprenol alpha-1,4-N-acetyl-D-galactosaminyltransferase
VEKGTRKCNQILSVGRLIESKHHDRLIHIFKNLKNADDWQLVIVGGDALRQSNYKKLCQLVEDLNLQGRVVLAGEQSNVDEYYASSQIFAFTSSLEGFPNVVGEALSCGLPVVSYDCVAGPSEMIINNTNGFLVPVFDDTAFLQKLQYLIDQPEQRERMSQNAKEVRIHFSAEAISQKFLQFLLYEDITN